MPDLEGIGAATTDGATKRSVEPAGAAADGHTHEASCLNCGCALAGDYCHCCGQKAHVHRTLAAWWHDFVHSVLHLDGKFWRTLPMLAAKPGELTRRYSHGERKKFISPLALFLFTVFLMFAVFSLSGNRVISGPADLQVETEGELSDVEAQIDHLERQRQAAVTAGAPTTEIDRQLEGEREAAAVLRRIESGSLTGEETTAPGPVEADLSDSPAVIGFFDEAYRKAKKNPSLLFYKLQANAYKFSWALIPLSVPFVWILFLHRRRYRQQFTAYDHFVFVTYSLAFMSLWLISIVPLRLLGIDWDPLDFLLLMIPPVHMFLQLRGAYELSKWSAAWRAAALLFFATIALLLFSLLLLAIGLFG